MAITTLADWLVTEEWPDELEPLSSGRARCHCGLPRRPDSMYDTDQPGVLNKLTKTERGSRVSGRHKTTDEPRWLCGGCLTAIATAAGISPAELERKLGR